jgi:hypothetical protein
MMLMMQMILITNMGCYSSTHLTRISTPRFLGKKRGKGSTRVVSDLQKLAMIFFLEEIDPRRHEDLVPSFMLKERGNNSRNMDLHNIEYLMVNSWRECL